MLKALLDTRSLIAAIGANASKKSQRLYYCVHVDLDNFADKNVTSSYISYNTQFIV